MNTEQRKAELKRIQAEHTPCMTGITLMYHGERKIFKAYKIPLSILTYNPYNGRIGSVVKSFEQQNHTINPDNITDVKLIEKFLWESKEEANERTMQSLLVDHQQRYGIVTADGRIIDGNRRASLLNRIWRDESIDVRCKQHTQFFIAIILPVDADKKELLRLETTYQMGEDAKVDYGPIEKYLKAKDLADAGFSNPDIASFMGVKPCEVKDYLRILELMNQYLDTYGYTGIYTLLHNKDAGISEDAFIKLEGALRQYAAGGVSKMWAYDVETDVSDLKNIAFDYIRYGLDQQDFRDIIRQPKKTNTDASFFSNEDIWRQFTKMHFDIVDGVQEQPVEDLRRDNPDVDISRLLRKRDTDWRDTIGDKLNENFQRSRDKLNNKQQAAEPIKLLQKAWEAMLTVDTTQISFKTDPGIKNYLNEIGAMVKKYESILQQ